MSRANIRTSSTMCCWATRTRCRRARFHPIFYGSFDWHSCVHGWWTLLTLRRLFPGQSPRPARSPNWPTPASRRDKVAAELRLSRPAACRPGSSGPMAGAGCSTSTSKRRGTTTALWAAELEPLARAFAERLRIYLAKLTYPIRVGTHFNTAFALVLALEWAEQFDPSLAERDPRSGRSRSSRDDRDCQAWEPGGDEFLSPALIEALCMARVLPPDEFAAWFAAFLPRIAERRAGDPVHAGDGQRPQRRQDRASRRAQPQPRLVLALDRAAAAGCGAGRRRGRGRRASRGGDAACRRRLYGRALAGELRAAGDAGGVVMPGCTEPHARHAPGMAAREAGAGCRS